MGLPDEQTGNDGRLVNIEATGSLDNGFHRFLQEGRSLRRRQRQNLPCVLPVSGCDKMWYLYTARVGLLARGSRTAD